jgi:hypothetical protein
VEGGRLRHEKDDIMKGKKRWGFANFTWPVKPWRTPEAPRGWNQCVKLVAWLSCLIFAGKRREREIGKKSD